MAGEWIKMRTDIFDDPRVLAICDMTDQPEPFVVGGLNWLWATADKHTVDGFIPHINLKVIDRRTHIKGFGEALVSVGWIEESEDGISIVRFGDHNGQSAKKRITDTKRKSVSRAETPEGVPPKKEKKGDNSSAARKTSAKCPQQIGHFADLDKNKNNIKKPETGNERSAIIPPTNGDPPGSGSGVFVKLDSAILSNNGRLRSWFDWQAGEPRPVVGRTEADWLKILTAAVKSLSDGGNPPALFAVIVGKSDWGKLSNAHEDSARQRLREWRNGQSKPSGDSNKLLANFVDSQISRTEIHEEIPA